MIPVINTNSLLSAAGDAYKSNAATTMMTTGLGFVRAGMVPFDKKASSDKKAQIASWVISATLLSLVTQLSVYKILDKFVDNISIKNLKLTNFANEYKNLKKLPLDDIDSAFKAIDEGKLLDKNKWNAIKASIKKSFDLTNPKEKQIVQELTKSLDDLAAKVAKGSKINNKTASEIVKNVKNVKGAGQMFMYLFGAALFTGYMIPAFITKYLPEIMQFGHDKIKINGKSLLPQPNKQTNKKAKKSNFALFGIPLLASGGALAFLNYHKLNMEKGAGQSLHKAFKAIAKWDYNMSPNTRIIRNITTNAILRPAAALLDGRVFLAVYNFMMEALSAGTLIGTKKVLGSATSHKGLIGKITKNMPNRKHALGVEFIMTHGIQTFLVLGVFLGLTTTILSRHITKFTKDILKIKSDEVKENEVPKEQVFPSAAHMTSTRSSENTINHKLVSDQLERYLIKTGNYKK